ncbi:MAG TPA: ABC transporter permease [Vicinamibacterales bacterium]|nr:ABC transporter permease [Vicinamibacterales bacterium]
MSLWRQLARGVRVLANRDAADRDVSDEVQQYFDEAVEAGLARGLSPDAARRAARLEIGNVTAVREEIRSYGWENVVGTLASDLRYGARRLRRSPGFTAITVLTLAIGIGGATAIFSAVNPILFASLPYPHADRIVAVEERYANGSRSDGTFAMYREFAERARAFSAIAVFRPWRPSITGTDRAERLEGQRVSAEYFSVLGVLPLAGRNFTTSDDAFRGPNVVVLSDELWRRRFNADRAVIGREVRLDDNLYTVIGVMPGGFENVTGSSAALWAPLQYDPSLPANGREWGHHLRTIARLRPGTGAPDATREVAALGRALIETRHPDTYDPDTQFAVAPLHDELTRAVKPALLAILGAVALVLVIACVNVTNLVLARGVRRRGEFALRAALGAGGTRLVRQVLTESVLLAGLGGVAGVAVAFLGVRGLIAVSPAGLPRAGGIRVDGAVLIFATAVTTLIGLAFGLLPALQAAHTDPHRELQPGSRRTSGAHRRTRSALVVAEIALALVLLVSSGLLLRSLQRLFAVPLGFDSARMLTMQLQIVGHRFDAPAATQRIFDQTLEAVRRVPGVAAAGSTSQLPLSGDRDEYGAHFAATPTQPADTYGVFRYAVSPGYIEAAGIPLRAGRVFDAHDDAAAPRVAVISESLARARFRGLNPIGERLGVGPAGPFTIVGIVGDVRQVSLALSDTNAVYISAAQSWFPDNPRSLVIRARGDAAALAPAIREAIWSVDKDQPIARVATMDGLVAASAAERRFALILFEAFGLAALVLAAIGTYGLLSGSVTERTREIGVRSALGASRRQILTLILRQGLTLTSFGVAIGLLGALAASRALVTLLFSVTRLDPITYAGVVALLLCVSAIACWFPAWRAARVDPSATLRAD